MTTLSKLSDFAAAPSDFDSGDTLVGVRPGVPNNTDYRFSSSQLAQLGAFRLATANKTFFVAPAGSDANDGLTTGTAFATMQHAVNVAASYNWQNLYIPSINIANGTYAADQGCIIPPLLHAPSITINFDLTGTPANVVGSFVFVFNMNPEQTCFIVGSYTTTSRFPFQPNSGIVEFDQTSPAQVIRFTNATGNGPFIFSGGGGTVISTFTNWDFTAITKLVTFFLGGGSFTFTDPQVFFSAAPFTVSGWWAELTGNPCFFRWHSPKFFKNGVLQGGTGNPDGTFITGARLLAQAPAVYSSESGTQSELPGNSDGPVDSGVIVLADHVFSTSGNPTASSEGVYVLPNPPVASSRGPQTGDILPNSFMVTKDRTNGQRWLAVNDAGTPVAAPFSAIGKVYLKQVGTVINTQTGASYTAALTDTDGVVEMTNAGANTFTVPPNASVAFNIGDQIKVVQGGAGVTTIAAGAGVTVRNVGAIAGGQWKTAKLIKRAADDWIQINGAF
jgi:hypothetical protein